MECWSSLPNVTVADLVSPSVVTSRLVILPLDRILAQIQSQFEESEETLPEAEEVADLLVFGLCRDVLYVNCSIRHDGSIKMRYVFGSCS